MDDIDILQGETIRLTATVTEDGAVTAELFAYDGDGNTIETDASFVDKVADLTTLDTDVPAGVYDYYVKVTWDDNSVDFLTKKDGCDGEDCEMPTITVCEIEQSGSS